MVFYDGVSRGEIFKRFLDVINSIPPEGDRNNAVRFGVQLAMDIVTKLPAEGMWHDPDDERYPVPQGVLVNVEITQGHHQSVGRAWWTGDEWRTVGGVLSNEWITGWQMLPKPREEKQHD